MTFLSDIQAGRVRLARTYVKYLTANWNTVKKSQAMKLLGEIDELLKDTSAELRVESGMNNGKTPAQNLADAEHIRRAPMCEEEVKLNIPTF